MNRAILGFVCLVWTCGSIAGQVPREQLSIVNLQAPIYPPIALAARVWGEVNLDVTLRSDGTASTVAVQSGPPMLLQAAIDSATRSRFGTNLEKTSGTYRVIYRFVLDEMNCDEQRDSSYPRVKYEGNVVTIAEQNVPLCDPGGIVRYRSLKCLYLWKCGSKT